MLPETPINLLPDNKNNFTESTSQWKKRSFYIAIGLIIVITFFGALTLSAINRGWWFNSSPTNGFFLTPKSRGILQAVKNFIFKSDPVLAGQEDDRINILLLGIGGAGHDGPYLSDTNIVVSIKPSTKQVALISIPRDLGVKIPSQGWRKINYASAYGEALQSGNGGEYARKIFEDTLDLPIPYYARVDFTAFAEMIDAVGGVTVDVTRGFTDSAYPGVNSSGREDTSYQTITFTAGVQTMDGTRALQYARSRHGNNGEGSDFARAHRQQLIISALKEKLLSFGTYTNPMVVQKILNSLEAHVTTNLSIDQLIYLAGVAKEIDNNPKTLVIDDSPNGFLVSTIADSGAYMLFPKTGNFDKINEAVKNIFDSAVATPSDATTTAVTTPATANNTSVFPTLKIEIKNGTWRAGLASRVEKKLEEKGFAVIAVGNNLKRPIANTTLYVIQEGVDAAALGALQAELGTKNLSQSTPGWLLDSYDDPQTTGSEVGPKYNQAAEVVIVLGEDYKE